MHMNSNHMKDLIKSLAAINSDLKKMIAAAQSNLEQINKRMPDAPARKIVVDHRLNRTALVQHILISQN